MFKDGDCATRFTGTPKRDGVILLYINFDFTELMKVKIIVF